MERYLYSLDMLDHVSLRVTDLMKSRDFYMRSLLPLGATILFEEPETFVGFGDNTPIFWVTPAKDGQVTTGAHVAFSAKTREMVDGFYNEALAAGGHDNGAPGIRSEYEDDYYAAFILDPDGNNIEAVCHLEAAA